MKLGIDLGGTKIEIIALDNQGVERLRRRVPTPQGDYSATLLFSSVRTQRERVIYGAC